MDKSKIFYNHDYKKTILKEEENSHTAKLMQKMVGEIKEKTILDVGCGSGKKLAFLARNNKVFGVDISKIAVQKAKKRRFKAKFVDIEKGLPFPSNKFDIVICSEVLEHLFKPSIALKEIKRVLKKEGVFFCTIPNHFTLNNRLAILLGKNLEGDTGFFNVEYQEWDYPHIRFFTWKGIHNFLQKEGFEVTGNYSYLVPAVFKISLFEHLGLCGKFMSSIINFPIFAVLRYKYPDKFCASFFLKCRKS